MVVDQANPEFGALARRRWRISGQVQGVGFRPFVCRLAIQLQLNGLVLNDGRGVLVEAQGTPAALDEFAARLERERPVLAEIQHMVCSEIAVCPQEHEFQIASSDRSLQVPEAQVTVDSAVCPDCLAELLNPADRRFGYGLINCTNCGPRYTIVRQVPYDRPNTTMAGFAMCPACQAEYSNPADRRFHAQPVACHQCGPKVQLVDNKGAVVAGEAIATAARWLVGGRILAIKGLGGFHLAVLADNQEAVRRLRLLKYRDAKPFALMCPDLVTARRLVRLSDKAAAAMTSPACPIVLCRRQADAAVAEAVAPGNHRLGVMLPYTPIQHLLFHSGGVKLGPLVMTSANISDEPLMIDNDDALRRLGDMCDGLLWHDRPIERAVDDSVLLDMGQEGLLPVRRARGYVPGSLPLNDASGVEDGLCVGGELKNALAVVRQGRVILSHHIGDLTHTRNFASFRRAVDDMCQLMGVRPRWIAHDLHPAYMSTVAAGELAKRWEVPLLAVQHHHAHAAAVLAEHGRSGPALAVVCDGVGYGSDGTMWGGELLLADLQGFKRLGRLSPMMLAGGDAAARDCRRCGLALLYQAMGADFADHPAARRLVDNDEERSILTGMIRNGLRCVVSSGAGRVFDGVAALLGVCQRNSFEAQAAIALEAAAFAAGEGTNGTVDEGTVLYQIADRHDGEVEIGLAPLVKAMVAGVESGRPTSELALLFHDQFAAAWAAAVRRVVGSVGIGSVVLSGGVFCNELLTRNLTARLTGQGLEVLRHRLVPAGDGGLAFGQAAVAVATVAGNKVRGA